MLLTNVHCLFFAHGFGINTNIFETNVINLAVVIAVVISFVGDAIKDLLANRKQTILDNLFAAEKREKELDDRINQAKNQLDAARQKAVDIRQQSSIAAKEEQALCIAQADQEAETLKQRKEDSIRLQQQKAIKQISKKIISLSLQQAREKASNRSSERRFQLWVNRARFTHYRTVDKYLKNLV